MKKATNLKKRLDELRDEPELPTELTLKIDPNLHRTLKHRADQEQCSLQDYILSVLRSHLDVSSDDETGYSK
jgi:predicted HicB family RNase H-like nuclease